MRIAELAELTGVTPRRLRHFEARGLLSPARDERGWRDYDHHDRQRVDQINQLVRAGIPTDLALHLLDTRQRGAAEALPPGKGYGGDALVRATVSDELLADILAFYRQIDRRARCLAHNRDALAAWLNEHGVHDFDTD